MESKRFTHAEAVPERSSSVYSVEVLTPDSEPVDPTQLDDILLSLRDERTDDIVNSREDISVLNQNGGTMTNGLFQFQFEEDDTAFLGSGTFERRILTLDFHLTSGQRITRDVAFYVRNLRDITI